MTILPDHQHTSSAQAVFTCILFEEASIVPTCDSSFPSTYAGCKTIHLRLLIYKSLCCSVLFNAGHCLLLNTVMMNSRYGLCYTFVFLQILNIRIMAMADPWRPHPVLNLASPNATGQVLQDLQTSRLIDNNFLLVKHVIS